MKKLLCAILAMALSVALMSPAFALTGAVPDGWIPIYTPQDLDAIRDDLDANYILMNDIDMSGWGQFEPIGDFSSFPVVMEGPYGVLIGEGVFRGSLDGNGYEIQNLAIRGNEERMDAAFISVLDGTIENLGMVNADVDTTQVAGMNFTAGLVAHMFGGTIENCYIRGAVKGAKGHLGAFVAMFGADGLTQTTPLIKNCYSIGTFDVVDFFGYPVTGGIVGGLYQGILENCYSSSEPLGFDFTEGTAITLTNTGTLTLEQMTRAASFVGFDWTTPVWYIKEGETYPKLRPFPEEESPTYFPDPGTGVAVTAPDGAFPPGTEMVVDPLSPGNFTLGPGGSIQATAVFDIKFLKDGVEQTPGAPVTVRLPLTGLNPNPNASWRVYYVERDAGGNVTRRTDMNARVVLVGGAYYLEFETDHFSIYAVALLEDPPPIAPPKTHFWESWPPWAQWILKYIFFGWLWMPWLTRMP